MQQGEYVKCVCISLSQSMIDFNANTNKDFSFCLGIPFSLCFQAIFCNISGNLPTIETFQISVVSFPSNVLTWFLRMGINRLVSLLSTISENPLELGVD